MGAKSHDCPINHTTSEEKSRAEAGEWNRRLSAGLPYNLAPYTAGPKPSDSPLFRRNIQISPPPHTHTPHDPPPPHLKNNLSLHTHPPTPPHTPPDQPPPTPPPPKKKISHGTLTPPLPHHLPPLNRRRMAAQAPPPPPPPHPAPHTAKT